MRADQDVDAACFQVLENLLLLLGRAKARDHLDCDRELPEALLECLVVLKRKHRRRRQHGHLLAVLHGLERRTHRHFRLAVAHVAAQQAVHRQLRLHVGLDVANRRQLVIGFREVEGVLKLALEFIVRRELVAARGLALRVELEQLIGHVLHGLLNARLGLGPALRAEFVQDRRRSAFARAVFLDQVKPRQRHVQPRAIGELKDHELDIHALLLDLAQAHVAGDAVLHVHHIIVDRQIAEI